MIVNCAGQGVTFGHHSPLGAYHADTDRFLLLDVWPDTYECWATATDLYAAMNTVDSDTGKTRGYCIAQFWLHNLYRESEKNDAKFSSISLPDIDRFATFFTDRLGRQFAATKWSNILISNTFLRVVATLILVIILLQIVCRVCQWKHLKNQSTLCENMEPCFLNSWSIAVNIGLCIMTKIICSLLMYVTNKYFSQFLPWIIQ